MDRLHNPEREWNIVKEATLVELLNIKSERESWWKISYPNHTETVEERFDEATKDFKELVEKATNLDDLLSLLENLKIEKEFPLHDIKDEILRRIKKFVKKLIGQRSKRSL